jgi:copper chaperone CopZ
MSTQTFAVDGMTCSHCVAAVTAELVAIAEDASVDIVLGTPSTVTITAGTPLPEEKVVEALDEAGGYTLHPGGVG